MNQLALNLKHCIQEEKQRRNTWGSLSPDFQAVIINNDGEYELFTDNLKKLYQRAKDHFTGGWRIEYL